MVNGYVMQGALVLSLGVCILGYAGAHRLLKWLKGRKHESSR